MMVVGDARSVDLQVPRGGLPEPDAVRGGVPRAPRSSCSTRTTGRRSGSSTPPTPSSPTTRRAAPKHLWTEQVGGELITRYHAEDEHDEAAFVVARDRSPRRRRATTASATSRSSTAPTRRAASSRRRSCAPACPYRVVGGVKFYDRREVKDALAYLRGAGEPRRRGELEADRQHAQAWRRRHVGAQGRRVRAGRGRHVPRCARDAAAAAGVTRQGVGRHPRPARADGRGRAVAAGGVGATVEAMLDADRLPRRARSRAVDRGAGPHREPAGARRRLPRVRRALDAGDVAGLAGDRRASAQRRRHAPATTVPEGLAASRRSSRRSRSSPTSTRRTRRASTARSR